MTNKLGLIAGEGKMPVAIAQKATAQGYEVFVIGLRGNANEKDFKGCATQFKCLRMGQVSAGLDFFHSNGVKRLVMAGRIQHTSLFTNLMPDARCAKFLASLKNIQSKYILSRVIEELQKEGFTCENSALFLEDYFPKKGILTKRAPSEEEQKTIDYGYKIAKEIARLDIGLTCVVSQQAVVAVEGMEGTDKCILRAGELYKKNAEKQSPIAVVKVARPEQDNRYDLPVIGKGTLKNMRKAGISMLAFEAEKTLVMDLEEVIELANKYKMCIVAI